MNNKKLLNKTVYETKENKNQLQFSSCEHKIMTVVECLKQ